MDLLQRQWRGQVDKDRPHWKIRNGDRARQEEKEGRDEQEKQGGRKREKERKEKRFNRTSKRTMLKVQCVKFHMINYFFFILQELDILCTNTFLLYYVIWFVG